MIWVYTGFVFSALGAACTLAACWHGDLLWATVLAIPTAYLLVALTVGIEE